MAVNLEQSVAVELQAVEESAGPSALNVADLLRAAPMGRSNMITSARRNEPDSLRQRQVVAFSSSAVPGRCLYPGGLTREDGVGTPGGLKGSPSDPTPHRRDLAILLSILEAGYVRVDTGTSQETYVWPYFARMTLRTLTPQQQVELFRIATGADYKAMLEFGAYSFYRLGIAPDGTWMFFVSGD